MSKQTARRSIIDHTITCPHCGHRTLLENQEQHIRTQHPTEYEDSVLIDKMTTVERKPCPYCNRPVPTQRLESHIAGAHALQKKIAEQHVAAREREEQLKRRLRQQRINSPRGRRAMLSSAWREEQQAEKAQQRAERNQESIYCPYCYQLVLRGEFDQHLKLNHTEKK